MNKKIIIGGIVIILICMFVSCDREISISQPQVYEIGKSSFYISTHPPGAAIYADGKNTGLYTPDTINWLAPGDHKFILKLDPFLDYTFYGFTTDDQINSTNYDFYSDSRNFGSLSFTSKPNGCTIYLNDELLSSKTPFILHNLIPAYYKVKYSFPDHRSDSLSVFVYAGEGNYVNMTLADTSIWVTYNTQNSFMPDNTINDIFVDDDNTIWVGTWHNGIVVKRNGKWEYINTTNSNLPGNIIHKIKKDKFNNIWVATYSGLAKITNNIVSGYTTINSGLSNNYISDLDFDQDGNIWIGTQNGLVKYDGNSKWVVYKTTNSSIPANFITSVTVDKSNTVWIGTNAFSTIKFDKQNTWTTFQSDKSPIGDAVTDLIVDGENNLWVGLATSLRDGKFGGIYSMEMDSLVEVNFGIVNKHINSFYLDNDNTIWIGSRSGLIAAKSKYDYKVFVAGINGLPINDILSTSKDKEGNLWIGTNGRGLVKYKMWKEN